MGADPDVKDLNGWKPIDLVKNEGIKERLKTAISLAPILSPSLARATLTNSAALEAPVLKGTMLKWTNYSSGYLPRYFVLEGGVFSYYHEITDYPLVCRGSISTLASTVTLPEASDHSRFDVTGSGNVKYSLKARSPTDAKNWVWALMESQRWMKDAKKSVNIGDSFEAICKNPAFETPRSSKKHSSLTEIFNALGNVEKSTNELFSDLNTVVSHIKIPFHATDAASPLHINTLPPSGADAFKSPEIANTSWDMHRLIYLLQVQMQVQQRAVQSAIELIQSQNSTHSPDLNHLPPLLSHSAVLVQSTASRIVEVHEAREAYWSKKLKKELETRKRWEEVVHRVVKSSPDEAGSIKSIGSRQTCMTSEEIYYDAIDAGSFGTFRI